MDSVKAVVENLMKSKDNAELLHDLKILKRQIEDMENNLRWKKEIVKELESKVERYHA